MIDGVSLIWRDGASGGFVKLADLPPDLQRQYGYDPVKSSAADIAEKERKARDQLAQQQAAQSYASTPPANDITGSAYSSSSSYASSSSGSSSYSSGSGRVYVHSYTRRDGTYVSAHTRSAPRRH